MEKSRVFDFPKLDGSNYRDWYMKLYLLDKGLFVYVDGTIAQPEDATAVSAREHEDRKALTAICLAVEPSQRVHVMGTETSKAAWDALSGQFVRVSLSQKCRLRKRFHSLNLHENARGIATDGRGHLRQRSSDDIDWKLATRRFPFIDCFIGYDGRGEHVFQHGEKFASLWGRQKSR